MTDQKNEVDVALKVYTKHAKALLEFDKKHEKVLFERVMIEGHKEKAEKLLKITARTAKEGAENNKYNVTVIPKWKKWYDLDAVYGAAKPKERKLIEDRCLVQELDKGKFEELVKSEDLPRELKQIGFREQEMTSAVVIKEK